LYIYNIYKKKRALAPYIIFIRKKIGFIRVALFYVQKNDFTFAIPLKKMTCTDKEN